MARVFYTTAEGEDRSVRLAEHRQVRIGREPSNDLVLRDPKASRVHAQIVFEKGFYVIHDLDSANGTWVEGRRIRVAPLREGAEIRIGNTTIRFSEEVSAMESSTVVAPLRGGADPGDPSPSRAEAEPASAPPAAQPIGRPASPESEPSGGDPFSEGSTRAIPMSRLPATSSAPAVAPADLMTTQRQPVPEVGSGAGPAAPDTEPDELRTERGPNEALNRSRTGPRPHRKLENRQLLIDDLEPGAGESAVRNELDQPLIWFRGPRSAIALLAGFVATMIIVTGVAVVAFLIYEKAWVPAGAAVLITFAFATMVGAAIPLRSVPVWETLPPGRPMLTLVQEKGLPLPQLRFAVLDSEGTVLAVIAKRVFPSLGRRVWRLLDAAGGTELARASEDSFVRSIIGRIIGGSIRVLRTNYEIHARGTRIGTLDRARGRPGRLLLDLSTDDRSVERQLLVALALAIVTVER